jgi:hypothetical protein
MLDTTGKALVALAILPFLADEAKKRQIRKPVESQDSVPAKLREQIEPEAFSADAQLKKPLPQNCGKGLSPK